MPYGNSWEKMHLQEHPVVPRCLPLHQQPVLWLLTASALPRPYHLQHSSVAVPQAQGSRSMLHNKMLTILRNSSSVLIYPLLTLFSVVAEWRCLE